MKYLAIIMAIICRCACAQSDYGGILTNMVTALKQNGGTLNASFANQLASGAGEITNAVHLSNINLVRAISLVDVAEYALNGDIVVPQAISICSNILTSTEIPLNAWQKGVSGIVLSSIYSFDGKRSAACCAITNDVVMAAHDIVHAEDISLWEAIAKHLYVEGLTVKNAMRCYAAVAIAGNDPTCNITTYTNGLPESVLVRIRELSK